MSVFPIRFGSLYYKLSRIHSKDNFNPRTDDKKFTRAVQFPERVFRESESRNAEPTELVVGIRCASLQLKKSRSRARSYRASRTFFGRNSSIASEQCFGFRENPDERASSESSADEHKKRALKSRGSELDSHRIEKKRFRV